MNEFEFWDITKEEDYKPSDYSLAGAGDIVIPKLFFDKVWLLDQWIDEYTRWACVPMNCYLSLTRTLWLKPDWDYFINFLKDLEKDNLWTPWIWASLPKVMDYMRKRWNKDFKKNQITYFRDDYTDQIVKEWFKKGYRLVFRYGVTIWYTKDRDDNLVIDKTSYGETEKYWHIVSMMFSPILKKSTLISYHPSKWESICTLPDKWDWFYVLDQYPFKRPKSNIYQINTLKDLIKNWVYSQWAYTILRK